MGATLVRVTVLMILFVFGMGIITYAIEGHDPVSPAPEEGPTELPPCPLNFNDSGCFPAGIYTSNSYNDALGGAGNLCDQEMRSCHVQQTNEVMANKSRCETVVGCTLKYRLNYDECEKGNWLNCNPLVDNDPANTTYACTISGKFDYTNYRCDRGAVGEGEFTA